MKHFWGLAFSLFILLTAPANAVEYQGKNIDGRRFDAKAYSYETGGIYDIQVQFERNRATMYFVGGSQITIRLKQGVTNLDNIEGYSPGPLSIGVGGVSFGVGIASSLDNSLDNPQSLQPRPFKGFWRISLQEMEL